MREALHSPKHAYVCFDVHMCLLLLVLVGGLVCHMCVSEYIREYKFMSMSIRNSHKYMHACIFGDHAHVQAHMTCNKQAGSRTCTHGRFCHTRKVNLMHGTLRLCGACGPAEALARV